MFSRPQGRVGILPGLAQAGDTMVGRMGFWRLLVG